MIVVPNWLFHTEFLSCHRKEMSPSLMSILSLCSRFMKWWSEWWFRNATFSLPAWARVKSTKLFMLCVLEERNCTLNISPWSQKVMLWRSTSLNHRERSRHTRNNLKFHQNPYQGWNARSECLTACRVNIPIIEILPFLKKEAQEIVFLTIHLLSRNFQSQECNFFFPLELNCCPFSVISSFSISILQIMC